MKRTLIILTIILRSCSLLPAQNITVNGKGNLAVFINNAIPVSRYDGTTHPLSIRHDSNAANFIKFMPKNSADTINASEYYFIPSVDSVYTDNIYLDTFPIVDSNEYLIPILERRASKQTWSDTALKPGTEFWQYDYNGLKPRRRKLIAGSHKKGKWQRTSVKKDSTYYISSKIYVNK